MKFFSSDAYELSRLHHDEMFKKLNSMTEGELNILRVRSTNPHMRHVKEVAERTAYVDTTVATLLRIRHQESGRDI